MYPGENGQFASDGHHPDTPQAAREQAGWGRKPCRGPEPRAKLTWKLIYSALARRGLSEPSLLFQTYVKSAAGELESASVRSHDRRKLLRGVWLDSSRLSLSWGLFGDLLGPSRFRLLMSTEKSAWR